MAQSDDEKKWRRRRTRNVLNVTNHQSVRYREKRAVTIFPKWLPQCACISSHTKRAIHIHKQLFALILYTYINFQRLENIWMNRAALLGHYTHITASLHFIRTTDKRIRSKWEAYRMVFWCLLCRYPFVCALRLLVFFSVL